MRAPRLLVLVALGVAAACSSSSQDLGPSPVVPDDGGSSSGSSGTTTSSSGSSGSTSGGPTDAGADQDAAEAGDGGRDLSTDRTKFFGTSRCATSGLQLCEDFESGTLDNKTWTVPGGVTAPVIDGVQHARGSKALHITMTSNGASYIKETKTFPATNNTYWGRAFMYFASLPAVQGAFTYAHWTFAAASGTGIAGEIRLSGQLQNGKNLFGVGTDNKNPANGTGDWTNSDNDPKNNPTAVPTGSWLCIEWLHDGAANETKFFWDATEHPSLATTATMHGSSDGLGGNPYDMPTFNNVWIGWQEYQAQPNEKWEMWVDEIGIDPQRIGCIQ